ncbi:hypothetical protein ABZ128_10565 [Streptomyces sp. NPDC006326]|uniref:hypothetical protein n=1 Tax=Streptomyces sp. NPDC006326 TaxID=3156752 RepID=UPI0033A05AC8
MPLLRRGTTTATLAAAVLMFGAQSAVALDNMYPNYGWTCYDGNMSNGTFCQTDNADFTVWSQGNVPSSVKTTIKNTIKNQYGPTDLTVSFQSSGTYTGNSETDLINQSGALPADTVGITWCDDAVTSKKCDQHYVRYNSSVSEVGPINGSDVCHETGHSVGLTHGGDANPRVSNTDSRVGCMSYNDVYSLGSNNRTNINSVY